MTIESGGGDKPRPYGSLPASPMRERYYCVETAIASEIEVRVKSPSL